MSKRKSVIIMLIVFLAIGFATVSTTLVLNGILAVGENKDDFNIIFTSAKLDGRKRNDFISEDKKHINFVSNELKTLDDKAILTYEITNTSRNYDADITLTCTAGTTELITLEYTPHQIEVPAGETKSGTLTVSMLKVVDSPIEVPIELTFTATAKTREELGDEYVPPFSRSGVMMRATNEYSNSQGLWSYRNNITKVVFENKLIPHETTEELTFDVSDTQDKSVMAYLIPNGEPLTTNKGYNNEDLIDTTAYTLYIQGDTGIKANSDSSFIFYYFNNLLEIENIQYLDTSNVTSMSVMFNNCKNLKSLDLSNFDTSKVTNMQVMFSNCNNLKSLDLSNFDTSKVTNMQSMFDNCNNLKSLDLSNFDTSNVTNMRDMFYNCDNLESLDLNNFNTSKVTNIQSMFYSCNNLTNIYLSNFDTSNVTNMSAMFYNCTSLTNVDVKNFDTSNVTDMSAMFYNCTSLTNVDVKNFDTSNVTDMSMMFSSCSSLKSIDISNFDTSNVTNMSYMFHWCSELMNVDTSNFNTSKVTNMYMMFFQCKNLTNLNVRSFDTSKVTDMYYMFGRCNNLTSLDVSNFDTSKVTNMAGMFAECYKIKSLDLSNFDTSNVTKMGDTYDYAGMFYKCVALTNLDISNFTFDLVTNNYGVFKYMPANAAIKVKDAAAQTWILNLTSDDRPSEWTDENATIKVA